MAMAGLASKLSVPSAATRLAMLTPPGRGAVATIGVRGPLAAEIVGQRFHPASGKSLVEMPPGRIIFGRFLTLLAEEELVVGLIGPDDVEVHCHGGIAAVAAVSEALVAAGCVADNWQEFIQSADHGFAAAARIALAAARTERTAGILLDQWRGALADSVAEVLAALERGDQVAACDGLSQLAQHSKLGQHLTQPWKVVLAGRPNVGKSSLINALLGFERSIVWAEPGTTRDVLTAATAIDGWPIEMADTAGLRAAGDEIEAEGIARARRQMAEADLVLLVGDRSVGWLAEDERLLDEVRQGSSSFPLVVLNKADLPAASEFSHAGLAISARTGEGLGELLSAISVRLVPEPPPAGAAVPFTEDQATAIDAALAACQRGDLPAAQAELMASPLSPFGGGPRLTTRPANHSQP